VVVVKDTPTGANEDNINYRLLLYFMSTAEGSLGHVKQTEDGLLTEVSKQSEGSTLGDVIKQTELLIGMFNYLLKERERMMLELEKSKTKVSESDQILTADMKNSIFRDESADKYKQPTEKLNSITNDELLNEVEKDGNNYYIMRDKGLHGEQSYISLGRYEFDYLAAHGDEPRKQIIKDLMKKLFYERINTKKDIEAELSRWSHDFIISLDFTKIKEPTRNSIIVSRFTTAELDKLALIHPEIVNSLRIDSFGYNQKLKLHFYYKYADWRDIMRSFIPEDLKGEGKSVDPTLFKTKEQQQGYLYHIWHSGIAQTPLKHDEIRMMDLNPEVWPILSEKKRDFYATYGSSYRRDFYETATEKEIQELEPAQAATLNYFNFKTPQQKVWYLLKHGPLEDIRNIPEEELEKVDINQLSDEEQKKTFIYNYADNPQLQKIEDKSIFTRLDYSKFVDETKREIFIRNFMPPDKYSELPTKLIIELKGKLNLFPKTDNRRSTIRNITTEGGGRTTVTALSKTKATKNKNTTIKHGLEHRKVEQIRMGAH